MSVEMGGIIDVGPEATGFIAIGQFATGFFALGQVATGVIAIGQVARGFFVVGQAAFGIVSLGMLSGGLIGTIGMLGVGGRGIGGILPLVPRLREARELPPTLSFDELARGGAAEGWVAASVQLSQDGSARIYTGSVPLPVRVDARLRRALTSHAGQTLLVSVRRLGNGFVAERLMLLPKERVKEPRWWLIWAAQLGLLFVASLAFWLLVVRPIVAAMQQVFA